MKEQENGKPRLSFQHTIFINEMIASGNRRLAYQAAYPDTKNSTACTNACRLLSKPEIANAIREGLLEIKRKALEAIREAYEGKIADVEEKRMILAQIMRGELVAEKETTTKKGDTQTTKVKGDPKDRIRAIILDNKMEEEWRRIIDLPYEGMNYVE
jgi:phage terminase small subunit